ncbi:DNRLRE domain-containing protein, partial [bacterium]|nr:DNRLRE domain-containing protein [bacterium]
MSVKTTMTFAIIATLFCAVIFATTETYYSTADGYMFQTLSPSSCDNIDGDNIKVGLQSSNDYYDGLICFTGITDVTVTSATLRLYVENITGTVASIGIGGRFTSSFSEPLPDCSWFSSHWTDAFGSIISGFTPGTWEEIDVTSLVSSHISDGFIAVLLGRTDVPWNGYVTFDDREGSHDPELVIETDPITASLTSVEDTDWDLGSTGGMVTTHFTFTYSGLTDGMIYVSLKDASGDLVDAWGTVDAGHFPSSGDFDSEDYSMPYSVFVSPSRPMPIEFCIGWDNDLYSPPDFWDTPEDDDDWTSLDCVELNIEYVPPDLTCSSARPDDGSTSPPFTVGQSVDWFVTINNIGTGDSPDMNARVGYYLGTSSSDYSTRISYDEFDDIASGDSTVEHDSYTFTIDDVGTRYLNTWVDYENDIEEVNEANNKNSYGPFDIITAECPYISESSDLDFVVEEAHSDYSPSSRSFHIQDFDDSGWSLEPSCSWVDLTPSAGTGDRTITVTLDETQIDDFVEGIYRCTIILHPDSLECTEDTINVELEVANTSVLLTPENGDTILPALIEFTILTRISGWHYVFVQHDTASGCCTSLNGAVHKLTSGPSGDTISVIIDCSSLPIGSYKWWVVSCMAGGGPPYWFSEECYDIVIGQSGSIPENLYSIALGHSHGFIQLPDSCYSFGKNDKGQLGLMDTTDRSSPTPVPGVRGIFRADAGNDHTIVLKCDGSVWTWGDNEFGQLGASTVTARHSPQQLSSLPRIQ